MDPKGPGSEPMLSVGPDGALYLQAIGREPDAPDLETLALPTRAVFEGALCTYGQGCPDTQRALGECLAVAFAEAAILAAVVSVPDAEAFDATTLAITVPLRYQ